MTLFVTLFIIGIVICFWVAFVYCKRFGCFLVFGALGSSSIMALIGYFMSTNPPLITTKGLEIFFVLQVAALAGALVSRGNQRGCGSPPNE